MTCQGCHAELPPQKPGMPRKWCSERCRKRTCYGGTCRVCGATTNGYDGPGTASDLCAKCAPGENKIWTREAIVLAIQEWEHEYDHPPHASDWNTPQGAKFGKPPRDTTKYPAAGTVIMAWGSWNAAITAAGLTPTGVGKYKRGSRHRRAA